MVNKLDSLFRVNILWSGVRDSNPCKSAWKADAQPLGQPRDDSDRTAFYSSNAGPAGASAFVGRAARNRCFSAKNGSRGTRADRGVRPTSG